MEGLKNQGLAALSGIKFVPAANEHELITVGDSTAREPSRTPIPLDKFLDDFDQAAPRPVIQIFKLHIRHPVVLKGLEKPVLNASREDVVRLWEHFNLDLSVFQLINKGVQGFYQHHTTSSNHGNAISKQFHYVLCSYVYCLVWTYSPSTQTTNAVMFLRPENHLGAIDFDQWLGVLGMQLSLARHPLCLFLTTMMQTLQLTTAGARGAQALINDIEWKTGFYPWMPASRPQFLARRLVSQGEEVPDILTSSLQPSHPRPLWASSSSGEMSLDQLVIASRNIGAVLVTLEDDFRQLKLLQLAIEAFTSTGTPAEQIRRAGDSGNQQSNEEQSVQQALRLYTQQIESCHMRLNYLRERSKNQATVVFNLMTRADTQASISLAKSAKKDSSSMKVIAVMTMAFLPATFLAALFAVPSLKWDAETVMQDNFWVFWAFALPATALVFGIWFLVTPGENDDTSLMNVLLSRLRSQRTKSSSGAGNTAQDSESGSRGHPKAASP